MNQFPNVWTWTYGRDTFDTYEITNLQRMSSEAFACVCIWGVATQYQSSFSFKWLSNAHLQFAVSISQICSWCRRPMKRSGDVVNKLRKRNHTAKYYTIYICIALFNPNYSIAFSHARKLNYICWEVASHMSHQLKTFFFGIIQNNQKTESNRLTRTQRSFKIQIFLIFVEFFRSFLGAFTLRGFFFSTSNICSNFLCAPFASNVAKRRVWRSSRLSSSNWAIFRLSSWFSFSNFNQFVPYVTFSSVISLPCFSVRCFANRADASPASQNSWSTNKFLKLLAIVRQVGQRINFWLPALENITKNKTTFLVRIFVSMLFSY